MGDRMMGTSRHGLRITGAFAAVMGAVVLLSGFGRAFAQQPTSQVEIRAAYWRVGGGFETSLLINNTQPQQISVQVVVYDHAGRRIPAQAVELGPLRSWASYSDWLMRSKRVALSFCARAIWSVVMCDLRSSLSATARLFPCAAARFHQA